MLVFVLVATAVAVEHPYGNEPVFRSDGLGYHAWSGLVLLAGLVLPLASGPESSSEGRWRS